MSLKKWKKTLFGLLMVFTGVLLLGITEGLLRAFDVGEKYELVEEVSFNHDRYWRINRHFPSKYFSKIQDAPEFRDVLIPADKPPDEMRILALGESTTFGFPYSYNITFPDMLEYMMNTGDTDTHWRIINLSTSAINSYSVVDILNHAQILQPDALMIYMGHNEFYGAFGSASVEKGFSSNTFTHFLLKIKEFRMYQLLEKLLRDTSRPPASSGPLMARVVRKNYIPYGSSLYLKTRLNFIKNLHKIHTLAEKMDIPVFIGTLVSNERDLIPFASDFKDEALSHESLYQEFSYYINTDDTTGAEMWLDDLELWEPNTAILAYCKAEYYEWTGKPDSAAYFYSKARDLDVLRFRAGSDWNTAIRQVARENQWSCIRFDRSFESYSVPNRPGNNLFHEHVHPNVIGYQLMAETILSHLQDKGFYSPDIPENQILDSLYSHYPLTPFEELAGDLTIATLTHRWPFRTEEIPFTFQPSNTTEHYSWEYVNKKITWGKANQALVEYHLGRNEQEIALRYTESIRQVIPFHPYPYLKTAGIYQMLNMPEQALKTLKAVDSKLHHPDIWLLEGEIYAEEEEYDFALFTLNECRMSLKKNPGRLSAEQKQSLYQLLVHVLKASNRFEQAERMIEEASSLYHIEIEDGDNIEFTQ